MRHAHLATSSHKGKTLHRWIQLTTDSHTREKTKRVNSKPMWYSPQRTLMHGTSTSQTRSPCGTVRSGLSRIGQVHHRHTHPMWYSPQWTLTHAWDKYITDTQPMWSVCSGLSRMGQVHHRHTQPQWYSPQRTPTHGASTSQTHAVYVVICIQH